MRDLLCLSAFPKSGVTYLSFLLFHCLFDDGVDIRDLERRYVIDIHAWPDLAFGEPDKPRIIKSHFPFACDRPGIRRTAKAIYLIRHPIDVMMSAWDYRQYLDPCGAPADAAALKGFVQHWLSSGGAGFDVSGTWRQHVRSWLDQGMVPVHLVTYTDLVDQPVETLTGILAFLELPIPLTRMERAIARSTMPAMAALEEEEARHRRTGVFYRPELARGYNHGRRFINKGHRDCYHTVLTDEERTLADRVFAAELPALSCRR
ncbi:sulfotransferase domain-containing protein [Asticcacaulis sp.]|uniref:sulfotransferase domain-containing protein n=1 Tax=Asticcacaulis sp. TaxID=1872648 RepID=UPI002615E813|nr:sulfotransferase domain-containing protein [Asticcacaulis sp.]